MERNIAMNKIRNLNLDLIRCIAVFGVISVHFFLRTGFYQTPVIGKRMILMTCFRTFFMYCVPLFLLLTGYLMNKKVLTKHYYKGLVHTLFVYFITSCFCVLYKLMILEEKISFKEFIKEILNFSGAPYSWYIEMYIGLFLIIPFLNILYRGIKLKTDKQVLLGTFLVIVTIPTFFNSLEIKIFPDWWGNIWPICYYLIGCYLQEYSINLSLKKNVVLLGVSWIVSSTFNIFRSYGTNFEWGSYNDWRGWENLLISVLIFILVKNIRLSPLPEILKRFIQKISQLSLGIYLSSWIADQMVYTVLNSKVQNIPDRFYYAPVAIGIVFGISTIISLIVDMGYVVFSKLIEILRMKRVS